MFTKTKHAKNEYILVFLLIYFLFNIVILIKFPFIHSDEAWLSGLSRNILENSDFSVTEPFFDLKPRYPHAIKILFHTIQIIFIKLLGYHVFNMRLISLIFGCLSLYFFYRVSYFLFSSWKKAMLAVLLLSLDIQFIYASHFARQEIIMVFISISAFYYFLSHQNNHCLKSDITLAIILGLSIGIHPNSFIISLPFFFFYLYNLIFTKKFRPKNLVAFTGTLLLFAFTFIAISIYLDPNFIAHYKGYGQEFKVFNPLTSKFIKIKYFYLKLYHQVSGTYYTPNIIFQFYFFPLVFLASLYKIVKNELALLLLLSISALNLGIILIGRFNQTSVIFQFPYFYLLIIHLLSMLPIKKIVWKKVLPCVLLLITFINSSINIYPFLGDNYNSYLTKIEKVVPSNAKVLANLNTDYYFQNTKLLDYRNLYYLQNDNMTIADYIRINGIEYIIYSEEMDVIYQERPRWNGMYGNLYYYHELQQFLNKHCELVNKFNDRVYAMRIVDYMRDKDWQVKIFKVKP